MPKLSHGTHIHRKGYPRLSAGVCRDKYVHILVAEGMMGRPLEPWEEVHHKDGDRSNPRWTNLIVIDKVKHSEISRRQQIHQAGGMEQALAAALAYREIMGRGYEEMEVPELSDDGNEDGFSDTSFLPEVLLGQGMDERDLEQ